MLLIAAVCCTSACKEEGNIEVHSLKFIGVHGVSQAALRDALATTASSKLPWGPTKYFDRARLQADLARVQAFYTDRGFPHARVVGFDAKLNDKQNKVDVTVTIEEGNPVRVASVAFTGFEVIPPDHLALMKKQVPLRIGKPRDRQLVVATHEAALNELRDHGYPDAKVAIEETPGADQDSVAVGFAAQPGNIVHFGPVEVSGVRTVGEDVVRRELAYSPGDLYRRSLVQETQRRLYEMNLFQFVNVEPLNRNAEAPEMPTRVTLAEGRQYRVRFGAGYGTEEKVRAQADFHHLNFFGGARSAGVRVRWSSLDRGVRFDVTQPYVFRPTLSLSGEGQQWYTYTPAYRAVTSGGKLVLTHRGSVRNSWSVSFTSERDRSAITDAVRANPRLRNDLIALGLDPRTDEQLGTLTAIGLDFHRSTADSVLDPRRGYQLTAHGEVAGGPLPGTFNYQSFAGDARHYLPIGERLVFATRIQVGSIKPKGGDEKNVPFGKKYFLGGATSVRGWGVYEVSPLSNGLPIGGDSMLALSAEVRAILKGKLGAVVFLDGGNVWADSGMMTLSDLRYAVGPGLRYQTPIGPLRVDLGYQLNPIPDLRINGNPESRHWRIHFSIGSAF